MSFPAYPDYVDSGVAWLGQVPAHWNRKPLFALVRELDDSNAGMKEDNLLSLSYGQIKRKNIDDNDGLLPASFETYQIVERDDIIWRLTDLQNDQRSLRTGIVRERGIITSAYLATRPTAIEPAFLAYLLRAYDLTKVFYSMGGGLRQSMKFSDVKWLPVMLPSQSEQSAIVAFLDREIAKIDALVAEQERLIALLKEKRQAVISNAVTKGLNPHAPMKNSGIQWLGEIPAHWHTVKFVRLVSIAEGQVDPKEHPYCDMILIAPNHIESGTGRLLGLETAAEQNAESGKYQAQAGDVIYSKIRPALAKSIIAPVDCLCSADMYPLKPRIGLTSAFLNFFILSPAFTAWATLESDRVAMPKINREKLNEVILAVPPLEEQAAITKHIGEAIGQFDDLDGEARVAINLLQERRAALVSAAVSGKIDVRGALSSSNVVSIDTARTTDVQPTLRACVGALSIRAVGSMGRMAVMKGGYLAEGYAGLSELGGTYQRDAAGPFCRAVIDGMERDAAQAFGIQIIQPDKEGERVTYHVPSNFISPATNLRELLGEERAKRLTLLFDILKDLNRDAVEAIATLFAVWNDLIASGQSADEDAIIRGVLTDWHPEKARKFNRDTLAHWLAWMRRNRIVPDGTAPRTDHQGSLFQ